MNWNKIKEQCPKASKIFQKWGADDEEFIMCADPRCSYDFFDEQGIIIVLSYIKGDVVDWWDYSIYQYGIVIINSGESLHHRTTIEEQAFEKAFEILEDKL